MKPKISLIIPVYNVEKYLKRSMESVLNQTIQEIEIILIDDGSSDSSGSICDEYAAKDSRVRVIHQANAGASAARNSGLEIAEGDYIGYVDADDCVSPYMFELMYDQAEKTGADFSMCDYAQIGGNEDSYDPEIKKDELQCPVFDKEETFQFVTSLDKQVSVMVWNKLFRRKLIQGLKYDPTMRVCHDFDYLMKAITRMEKAVYVPLPLYAYFTQRPGSLTSRKDHDNDLIWNIESYHRDVSKTMDDFIRDNPDMRDHASAYKCFGDMIVVKSMIRAEKMDPETISLFRNEIRKNLFPIIKSDLLTFMKIQILVFMVSPKLFTVIYKNLKREKD